MEPVKMRPKSKQTDTPHKCKTCGAKLTQHQKAYCSRTCMDIARKSDTSTPKYLTCKNCSKQFPYRHDKGVPRKYCCLACYHEDRNKQYALKTQTEKWCCYCRKHLPLSEFQYPNSTACKKCMLKKQKAHVDKNKRMAVDFLGGKCSRCGYDRCLAALELHHTNQSKKTMTWSKIRGSNFEIIKKWIIEEEITCICSNCHREEHYLQFEHDE